MGPIADEARAIPEQPRRSRRAWPAYLALAVPVLGLLELGAHVFFSHRAPTQEQWADVRPLVNSWHHPGDVVVISPYWAEPMARIKFGDALMPLREVARPDITRYARALEVSIVGAHVSELKGWQVVRQAKQGPFTLRELTNPNAPTVTYDFADHLDPESADVRIEHAGAAAPCPHTATATIESGD